MFRAKKGVHSKWLLLKIYPIVSVFFDKAMSARPAYLATFMTFNLGIL